MSSFKADLRIEGAKHPYKVLRCSYEIVQETDPEGKPSSEVRGGIINLTIESSEDTLIGECMVDDTKRIDGKITFFKGDSEAKMKELEFKEAYVVSYQETFSTTSKGPMIEDFKLSSREITIGEMHFANDWRRRD